MIRFRVVKASHLLLWIAILALAVVAAFILLQALSGDSAVRISTETAGVKVLSTFASAPISGEALTIEVLPDPSPTPITTAGKRILIYHTHTHEAYAQMEDDPYVAVEAWRTEDSAHSVVRLGLELTNALRNLGYEVIHDTTDHEKQDISNAYQRSLETLKAYEEPFDLTIDLHRDAYVEGLPVSFVVGDQSHAQLMLLVGRGDDYAGEEKPDYSSNLAFAQQLTREMNDQHNGICRNVTVKKGRYNQHIGHNSILVEVGHNQNTLEQALNSIPCLAQAIHKVLQ